VRVVRAVLAGAALVVGGMVLAVPRATGASVPISMVDNAYQPAAATVHVGDTVSWCNNGQNSHSVVPDDGGFGTGTLDPGECSAPYRVTTTGSFRYDCSLENMRGTLTVTEAPAPTTTRAPSPATTTRPAPSSDPPSAKGDAPKQPSGSGATAITTASLGGPPPSDATVAAVVPDNSPPAETTTSEFGADQPTPTTRGDIAIKEVGTEWDPGQKLAVIFSAAVVALGGGYLAWHFRFGRR
jgi:plastocyanin